jgi:hypothetical protein
MIEFVCRMASLQSGDHSAATVAALRRQLASVGLGLANSFDVARSISAPILPHHRRSLTSAPSSHAHAHTVAAVNASSPGGPPVTIASNNNGGQHGYGPDDQQLHQIDENASTFTDDDQPLPVPSDRDRWDIGYLTACFFLLFTGYALCQSFVAAREPSYGLYSLALVYGSFATLGGLVGPSIVHYIGERGGLIVASTVYVGWMLVFAWNLENQQPTLFLAASALLGPSAGILWASQAGYMAKLVARTGSGSAGYFTSIFFTVHGLNILLSHSVRTSNA